MKRLCLLALAALCIGCEGQTIRGREVGAIAGTALGAGLGAIIGHATGRTGEGIAIGAGVGALSGGLLGNESDRRQDRHAETNEQLDAQQRQIEENQRLLEELKASGTDARITDRGIIINLPDVLFEFDSARLTGDARSTARDIARVVSRTGGRTISVEGHTDSLGTIEYNEKLSESRARAVSGALVSDGVPRRSLAVKGLGESDPIASNSTEAGRQRNRRVEVIIENK